MLTHILFRLMGPAVFPLLMVGMNTVRVVTSLLTEGRLVMNGVKFAVLYAGTIRSARGGDLTPFVNVLSMPG
jgi:hypothetical protein